MSRETRVEQLEEEGLNNPLEDIDLTHSNNLSVQLARPKLDHEYITHEGPHDLPGHGKITATTVVAHAKDPVDGVIGSYISVIHPRTRTYNHPDVQEHNATKENPQMELFQHHGPIIDNYGSHSQSGHTAPVVLGIAANLSKAQFNEVPVPATDLSKHSLRVVNQLGDSVPSHAEIPSSPTNDTDRGITQDIAAQGTVLWFKNMARGHVSPVSDREVAAGNDTMKQVVQRRIDKRKQAKAAAANPAPAPAPAPKATPPEQLRIPGI